MSEKINLVNRFRIYFYFNKLHVKFCVDRYRGGSQLKRELGDEGMGAGIDKLVGVGRQGVGTGRKVGGR